MNGEKGYVALMDHSPIDIEKLAQIANALFRGVAEESGPGSGAPPTPASSPPLGPVFDPRGVGPSNPTVGGATFSPSAPPNRPAFGRALAFEPPGRVTGQPPFDTGPFPGAHAPGVHDVPFAFDPRTIPGFAPIPHVEDGFDVSALQGLDQSTILQSFVQPTGHPGFGPASVPPVPAGPAELPSSGAPAPAFDAIGAPPFGLAAGGATFSPSAPPTHPAFGRPVAPDVPTPGHGGGPARFGLDTAVPFGLNPLSAPDVGGVLQGIDTGLTSSFVAPTNGLGLAAAPAPDAKALQNKQPAPPPRSIDRPTPNAFAFTDAPHLGEFPEESILRSRLAPQPDGGQANVMPVAGAAPADLRGLVPSAAPSFYFLGDGMGYFADDVPKLARPSAIPFNAEAVRADFPILQQRVNGFPLVWLDNGATTQKPQAVIDRISSFYENENSNINRSAHELAARASDAYEDARKTVQRFINAPTIDELVFVRGTTEGINFVAQSFGRRFIRAGDEIVLTHAEHHANIVPWYLLAKEVGATLRVAPFDDNGEILLDEYEKLLSDRVKIVAMSHVSNALGTVLPAKAMVEMAHRHGIPVLVDGAQSISHMPIDVQDIDCDFFVFSGHKVFAPTGIGAVYGKKALLDQMPPWQGGGNMIKDVTFEKITFQPAPGRFEAGTGNIADAVGLGEAFKYLERLGMTNIAQHEHALLDYATQRLASIKGLTIIGNAKEKAGVISFLLEGKEPVEVGKALNQKGIAVRAGHHCAMPILRRYGVEATVRPAFALYNTFEDADRLAEAVREIAAA